MGEVGLQLHRPSVQLEGPAAVLEGFSDTEIQHLLACTQATEREFVRDEVLVAQGEHSTLLGIVRKGTVLLTDDASDPAVPLRVAGVGEHYGEDLRWDDRPIASHTVTAATAGSAVLLDLSALGNADGHLCALRERLASRLVELTAENCARATSHRQILEHESLRERLAAFFEQQRIEQEGDKLFISMNREQLAAHLGAGKTDLVRELKAMKGEELIDFYRNSFRLLKDLTSSVED